MENSNSLKSKKVVKEFLHFSSFYKCAQKFLVSKSKFFCDVFNGLGLSIKIFKNTYIELL
jgi:hypothetical protein